SSDVYSSDLEAVFGACLALDVLPGKMKTSGEEEGRSDQQERGGQDPSGVLRHKTDRAVAVAEGDGAGGRLVGPDEEPPDENGKQVRRQAEKAPDHTETEAEGLISDGQGHPLLQGDDHQVDQHGACQKPKQQVVRDRGFQAVRPSDSRDGEGLEKNY